MDMLKIKSDFMNNLLSKLITRMIQKKTGYNITLSFDGILMQSGEDTINFQTYLIGKISKDDFMKLLNEKDKRD